jgi:hypothetical protein
MVQRIKPTDVTAAYRAAVVAARQAGVDTEGWNLKLYGSNFSIVTKDADGHESPVPGTGLYMGGYFAASYREAYEALHSMQRAWEMVPRRDVVQQWPCYHVQAANGMTYGVAASNAREAREMVAARLVNDGDPSMVLGATKVAEWSVAYGTTLCYGKTL